MKLKYVIKVSKYFISNVKFNAYDVDLANYISMYCFINKIKFYIFLLLYDICNGVHQCMQ